MAKRLLLHRDLLSLWFQRTFRVRFANFDYSVSPQPQTARIPACSLRAP